MSNYQKLTDEELVGLVRDEDQELYRYLIDRYQAKLLRYAVYLTGDDDQRPMWCRKPLLRLLLFAVI
jgi:hypothetical protein